MLDYSKRLHTSCSISSNLLISLVSLVKACPKVGWRPVKKRLSFAIWCWMQLRVSWCFLSMCKRRSSFMDFRLLFIILMSFLCCESMVFFAFLVFFSIHTWIVSIQFIIAFCHSPADYSGANRSSLDFDSDFDLLRSSDIFRHDIIIAGNFPRP